MSRQQKRLAMMLHNPKRKIAVEKRAESDPAFKKQLATIPPIKTADEIGVRRGASADESPITEVRAEYRFPADVNGREVIYSPSHQEVKQSI